jgi:predicted AAA+ superfamily ATPase
MPHIARDSYIAKIEESFSINPICALLGPRQCGKTTIAKEYQKSNPLSHLFDLEDPDDLQAFASPKLVIENLDGLIIIDEVQRAPELFSRWREIGT